MHADFKFFPGLFAIIIIPVAILFQKVECEIKGLR
jgi:hypothetical protein